MWICFFPFLFMVRNCNSKTSSKEREFARKKNSFSSFPRFIIIPVSEAMNGFWTLSSFTLPFSLQSPLYPYTVISTSLQSPVPFYSNTIRFHSFFRCSSLFVPWRFVLCPNALCNSCEWIITKLLNLFVLYIILVPYFILKGVCSFQSFFGSVCHENGMHSNLSKMEF